MAIPRRIPQKRGGNRRLYRSLSDSSKKLHSVGMENKRLEGVIEDLKAELDCKSAASTNSKQDTKESSKFAASSVSGCISPPYFDSVASAPGSRSRRITSIESLCLAVESFVDLQSDCARQDAALRNAAIFKLKDEISQLEDEKEASEIENKRLQGIESLICHLAECCVCRNFMRAPIYLDCGHMLCATCVVLWRQVAGGLKLITYAVCPICCTDQKIIATNVLAMRDLFAMVEKKVDI